MVKQRNMTRGLCALLALVLCAGVLAALPMRARAAGADYAAYGAGGGGGGGASSAPPSTDGGGQGGDGGANGKGDGGLPGVYNPVDSDGGAGGDGAAGLLFVGGVEQPSVPGGAGGVEAAPDFAGNNGSAPAALNVAPPAGGYGAITAVGGNGGNAGNASVIGNLPGGAGGNGGAVDLTFAAGDVTAVSVTVQGGGGGASSGGIAGGAGGNATLMVNGTLTVDALAVTGGDDLDGAMGVGGHAMLTVGRALAAGSISLAGGANLGAGIPSLTVDGPVSADTITVDGSGNGAQFFMNGGLAVPADNTTTLTVGSQGWVWWPGAGSTAITVGDGGTLTIENNSGVPMTIAGNVVMGAGATLAVTSGDVAFTGRVTSSLSGPASADVSAGDLTLTLSDSLNTVTGVRLGDMVLRPDGDYRVIGRETEIFNSFLYGCAMGPATFTVTLANGQTLDHTMTLTDPTPTSFTFIFPDTVGYDISLDGGATWTPLHSGGAVDTAPAAAAGGFLLRRTAGFLTTLDAGTVDISSNLHWDSDTLMWDITMRDAGGGPLHGAGILELGFVPMAHAYGVLAPQYGGGNLRFATTVAYQPGTRVAGVLLDGAPLASNTGWVAGLDGTDNTFFVQLQPAALAGLASGTHTLQVVFTAGDPPQAGYAEGSFAVAPAATPAPQAAVPAASAAPSPQTGDIGTGPYIVFAISGGLMLVWLGMQVFKRRDKDD